MMKNKSRKIFESESIDDSNKLFWNLKIVKDGNVIDSQKNKTLNELGDYIMSNYFQDADYTVSDIFSYADTGSTVQVDTITIEDVPEYKSFVFIPLMNSTIPAINKLFN